IEPRDSLDCAAPLQGRRPVRVQSESVGRGDTQTGHERPRVHREPRSGSRSTRALWKPPNPLPTDRTVCTGWSRAANGTQYSSHSGSRWCRLAVGGTTLCTIASADAATSIEPMAPRECPTMDLMELTGVR